MNDSLWFRTLSNLSIDAMADGLVKGTLILAAMGLAAVLMRRSSAAARHWLWFLGLVSLPLVVVLSGVLPAWRALPARVGLQRSGDQGARPQPNVVPVLTQTIPDSASKAVESPDLPEPMSETGARKKIADDAVKSAPGIGVKAPPIPKPPLVKKFPTFFTWPLIFSVGWLTGCVIAFVPVVLGALSLWRLKYACRAAVPKDWQDSLARAVEDLKLTRRITLLQSDRRAMPMTWGIWRPKLLLPAAASNWSPERRRDVLLHELAHVQRNDCLTDFLARIVCCGFWFHPLAWVALIRIRDLREQACDDIVIATGANAGRYAEHLLEIVAHTRPPRWAGGIAMARASQIKTRLRAILDDSRNRRPIRGSIAFATALIVLAGAAPVAMLRAAVPAPKISVAGAATAPAFQPAAWIEGEVHDSEGKAIADAEIVQIQQNFEEQNGIRRLVGMKVLGQCRSDAQGRFRLPHDAGKSDFALIRAAAPGYGYELASYRAADPAPLSIRLQPGGRIIGTVVDEQGQPLAGASVVHQEIESPAITDAAGRFSFDHVKTERVGIKYSPDWLEVSLPTGARIRAPIAEVPPGKETTVSITLDRGVLLQGTLTDADSGKPLRGFTVTALARTTGEFAGIVVPRSRGDDPRAYSDDAGHYAIVLQPGAYIVQPLADATKGAPDPNYYPLINTRELRIANGTKSVEVSFQFRRGRSIAGKLIDANRFKQEHLSIDATPAGDDISTDEVTRLIRRRRKGTPFADDGSFHLTQLKPGPYHLSVRARETIYTLSVDVPADRDLTDVAMTLPPESIAKLGIAVHGVVHYADGKPAINARIELRTTDDATQNESARTNELGEFTFGRIDPSQPRRLWVRDAAEVMGAGLELNAAGDLNKPLDVTLHHGAEFSGTVHDARGNGLAGFTAMINEPIGDRPGRMRSVFVADTDDRGHFFIRGFVPPAGSSGYRLTMRAKLFSGVIPGFAGVAELDLGRGNKQVGLDFVVNDEDRREPIKFTGPTTAPASPGGPK